jgi:uncharacterized protein
MNRGLRSAGPLFVLCAAALFLLSKALYACGQIDRTARIAIGGHWATVEIAVSMKEKTCGLSFRDSLPENHGMLFVYPSSQMMAFWMKDTRIPLSIAFIADSGKILNILEMNPMDKRTLYRPASPARYALEMSSGWFAERKVKPGDRVAILSFELPD